jgi:uncharacterized repeat protein (TIGR01451 family)
VAPAWVTPVRKALRRVGIASALRLAISVCTLGNSPLLGQQGSYYPLDQNAPLGRVAQWSAQIGKGLAGILQPVRVSLPTTGTVTVYHGGAETAVELGAPAQFSVGVASVYRLKLSGMPEFPGIALYPTLEILDRLHPPPGREQDFPVTISFTADQIQSAIDGQMVTTVVYLEQPQLAVTGDLSAALLNRMLPPDRNLLIEADRVGRPMILVRLGGRTPNESRIDEGFFGIPAPVSFAHPQVSRAELGAGRAVVRDRATTFTPADPRAQIEEDNAVRLAGRRGLSRPTPPRPYASLEPAFPPWELFPDEYLLDGGDRGFPVHETGVAREGLDTEDAVAEYVDRLGRRHILPTNRVAIYSPRFGTVGTTVGLEAGVTVARAAGNLEFTRGHGLRNLVAIADHEQRMPSQAVRVRSRASGFLTDQQQVGMHQRITLSENRELEGSVEGVQNQSAPALRAAEAAVIAKKRQAAVTWTRPEFPIVTASLAAVHQVIAHFIPNELVGVEDRRRPGRLEIVKLADKQTALPGEIVSFQIEYENIGDLELRDVQIIDNLTPRLDYVAESGNSDRPATLNVTDNGEGSAVLTWTMKQPLAGKSKGTVRFKARVR